MTPQFFLYINANIPQVESKILVSEFVNSGYNAQNIVVTESILDAIKQLNTGAIIVVHSIKFCQNCDQLLHILKHCQTKNITLRSMSEPWLNVPIIEYLSAADKIHKLITSTLSPSR